MTLDAFAQGYSKEQVEALERDAETYELIQLKNIDTNAYLARRESLEYLRNGYSPTNWNDYCKYFNVSVFAKPITATTHDKAEEDVSTPLRAFRLMIHTWYSQDRSLMLKYADDSGKKELELAGLRQGDSARANKVIRPELTKITLLFSAQRSQSTNQYVEIWYRREHPTTPKENYIFFNSLVLKQTDRGYLYTGDFLSHEWSSSDTGNPWRAAGVRSGPKHGMPPIGMYSNIVAQCEGSQLPSHFYIIED